MIPNSNQFPEYFPGGRVPDGAETCGTESRGTSDGGAGAANVALKPAGKTQLIVAWSNVIVIWVPWTGKLPRCVAILPRLSERGIFGLKGIFEPLTFERKDEDELEELELDPPAGSGTDASNWSEIFKILLGWVNCGFDSFFFFFLDCDESRERLRPLSESRRKPKTKAVSVVPLDGFFGIRGRVLRDFFGVLQKKSNNNYNRYNTEKKRIRKSKSAAHM